MASKHKIYPGIWVAVIALAVSLSGCLDMNDDPNSSGDSIRVSVSDLQAQLGSQSLGTNHAIQPPSEDEATTSVKTIGIGAVVIRSRDEASGPYTDEVPIYNLGEQLEQDIIDSGTNLQLVQLTGVDVPDEIEIVLPPPGAPRWQVMAVGFSEQVDEVDKLREPQYKDSAAYFGFHPEFLKTGKKGVVLNMAGEDIGEIPPLRMMRACLVALPPKGCAQYDEDRIPSGFTPGVEILAVYADGVLQPLRGDYAYPVKLRSTEQIKYFNVLGAPRANDTNPAMQNAKRISVEVTHQLATGASDACKTADTEEELRTNCKVSTFSTTY